MKAVKLPNIMSGSIIFENILSIRVLEWSVILVGCKIKGINELENLKFHLSDYGHYNSIPHIKTNRYQPVFNRYFKPMFNRCLTDI